ncbi:hypothetical protein ACFV3R_06630 [Streptomyces sp. NPDC059740]|uniref:hypothetical protein n=1 Tax=Streptomyces sp. NPDC059740 TaxID=3346926 RepID=UPI0036520DDB
MFRRRETRDDDFDRTVRLLEALEDRPDPDTRDDFEDVILTGCVRSAHGFPYPPDGHTYPRRG